MCISSHLTLASRVSKVVLTASGASLRVSRPSLNTASGTWNTATTATISSSRFPSKDQFQRIDRNSKCRLVLVLLLLLLDLSHLNLVVILVSAARVWSKLLPNHNPEFSRGSSWLILAAIHRLLLQMITFSFEVIPEKGMRNWIRNKLTSLR